MRGILSSTPSLGSIRLLIGGKVLLLVQAWLVFQFERMVHGTMLFVVGAIAVIGLVLLLLAIIGEPEAHADDHRRAWRRPSGRSLS